MKVLKFGGTSVATAARIKRVKDIVLETLKEEKKVVVVVSALGGTTDTLINMATLAAQGQESYKEEIDELYYRHRKAADNLFTKDEMRQFLGYLKQKNRNLEKILNGVFLLRELSPRALDIITSYGELVSSYMIAQYIGTCTKNVQHVDSREVIKTDSVFGAANVDFTKTNTALQENLVEAEGIYVAGGFVATNDDNITTTLGRGGSDYTAAIIAAALNAKELEIWTDVDGVMTADPRKVKKAFSLPEMTYEEALEMSHFGAKVIHPPTVQPALDKQIPIRIRNTFNPSFVGTLISHSPENNDHPVKGISSIGNVTLLSVQGSGLIGVTGIAGRLFSALAEQKINIILITQASSEHSICFAVHPKDAQRAKQTIEERFSFEMRANLIDEIVIEEDLSIVAVIGSTMKSTIGISGRLFRALGKNGVNVRAIAQGSSELNISVVINKLDETKALNALHEIFFLSDTKSIHLFLVGIGLIGKTLVQQIEKQAAYLLEKQSLVLKLVAVTNSRKMLFDTNGLPLDTWKKELASKGSKANLNQFVAEMKALNLPNSIFVDCTASAKPITFYKEILASSISIATPNKIANSSSLVNYLEYRKLAQQYNVKFLYETNVGAGLPVIKTLNDLLQSGDEVLKIEAVLSGSLSFIFNSFSGDKKFSAIVKEAKEKGFTEPDPRDDLSGMDVARKVLILSREIGQEIEISDIEVENILPEPCIQAETIDTFFAALAANDDYFTELRDKAAKESKVLRFLATIERDKASVSLKMVDASNPFYSLSGSDNMIVFTTARYKERPLVVKGPGAGAEVTAAGVFAEIISISNYLS